MTALRLRADFGFALVAGVAALLLAGVYALSAYAVSPFVVPMLGVAVAVLALTLARPAFGLGVAFLGVPAESLSLRLPTGSLSLSEGMLALVGIGYVLRLVLAPDSVVKPGLRDLPFVALIGVALLGVTVAFNDAPIFRVAILWTLFYCVYLQSQSFTRNEIRALLAALVVGAGILGLIGTVRYLASGNSTVFNGGTATGARAAGTFAEPNYYGSLLQLAIVPGVALVLLRTRAIPLVLPLAAALSGLAFSLSRGATVGLAVGLLLLLAWNRFRWLAVALIVIVTATTLANVNPLVKTDQFSTVKQRLSSITQVHESTTNNRPRIWRLALEQTAEHPIIGIGLNQFQEVATRKDVTEHGEPLENAHNIFLGLASETGLIGLALFLAFVGLVGRRAMEAMAGRDALARGLAVGLAGALVGFLIQGLTVDQLRDNLLTGTFLAFAGMLTALSYQRSSRPN